MALLLSRVYRGTVLACRKCHQLSLVIVCVDWIYPPARSADSGVTRVGVTGSATGNVTPIFPLKKLATFLVIATK